MLQSSPMYNAHFDKADRLNINICVICSDVLNKYGDYLRLKSEQYENNLCHINKSMIELK